MPNPATHLKDAFGKMSPLGKAAVFVAAFLVGCLLVTGGGLFGHSIARARYNAREAERMKQVQAALAKADEATKRAEAKEAQAELLGKQNEAKAGLTADAKAKLEKESAENVKQISETYKADVSSINSDASLCDRCRDTCSRLARVAVSNPELAAFQCAPDACSEQCPSESTH